MPNTDVATLPCPACGSAMKTETLEGHEQGGVDVDLCFACSGIWFDRRESVNLAPSAVISLFKEIHAHRDVARQPLAARLECPRCNGPLVLSHDVAKSGRFSYYRCLKGDGRFTPFLQFLREKQFIRTLTPVEVQRLRAEVKQVTCSQCGAPVDLELGHCRYCQSPLSLLDPDAVENAVRLWESRDRHRRAPAPDAARSAVMQAQGTALQRSGLSSRQLLATRRGTAAGTDGSGLGVDLIAAGIEVLGFLFDSTR